MDDLTRSLYRMQVGDAAELIPGLPRESIHCVITSPPYWDLHDYAHEDQLGAEQILDCSTRCEACYMCRVSHIFKQIQRRMHPEALLWLNLGDTYRNNQALSIPWRVCLRLQALGFRLVTEVVWNKMQVAWSPPVRPIVAHEYWFMLSVSDAYYYDADATMVPRAKRVRRVGVESSDYRGKRNDRRYSASIMQDGSGATRRMTTVWSLPRVGTHREVHRDYFPEDMVRLLIAGSTPRAGVCLSCGHFKSRNGELVARKHHGQCVCGALGAEPCQVLDPFAGSGMVPMIAAMEGRRGLGFEINPSTACKAVAFFQAQGAPHGTSGNQ